MNKTLLIAIAIIGLAIAYLVTKPSTSSVIQTQQEAAQEIKAVETTEEATDLTMEKIDEEFLGDLDDDFETDDLSDEALGI